MPLDFNIEQLNLANINITQKPLTPDEKPSQIFNLDQAILAAKADHQTIEISRLNLKSQQRQSFRTRAADAKWGLSA